MKERPILMSGPLVVATLAGHKTQTRRPIKPQPLTSWMPTPWIEGFSVGGHDYLCPYGCPGQRLWVRETFQANGFVGDEGGQIQIRYRADGAVKNCVPTIEWEDRQVPSGGSWDGHDNRWRPSIHMPRWACRLVLEITEVRVERVQCITYSDIADEGVLTPSERALTSSFARVLRSTQRRRCSTNLWRSR